MPATILFMFFIYVVVGKMDVIRLLPDFSLNSIVTFILFLWGLYICTDFDSNLNRALIKYLREK